jgi:TPR repeat protein
MYYFGHGCTQDHTEAEKWWRKAAKQGHAESAFNLGQILRHEEDADEAVMWMKRAAELGSDHASTMLEHYPYNPPESKVKSAN